MRTLTIAGLMTLVACSGTSPTTDEQTESADSTGTRNESVEDSLVSLHHDSIKSDDGKMKYLDAIDEATFKKASQRLMDTVPRNPNIVSIRKDTIEVRLKTGKNWVYANNNQEGESYSVYRYAGAIRNHRYVFIDVGGWEWGSVKMIDIEGKEEEMDLTCLPVFSPGGARFATWSAGLEGMSLNKITLYAIEADGNIKVILSFDIREGTWEPYEIRWQNESTIYMRRGVMRNGEVESEYVSMKMDP